MSRKLLSLLALAAPVSVFAQTNYIAKHIVFKNPGQFTQAQLEATAGIHLGASLNATTMNNAAQRLIDTGYFDDINAELGGAAADTTLIFNLKPTPTSQMLHVGFENLVWLTHDEVEAATRKGLPLFNGYLPENSPKAEPITNELRSALAAKGITANINSETVEPTLLHPERTLEFRISTPDVRVTNVKLGGVTATLVPLVQKSINSTARTLYNEGLSGTLTSDSILEPLLDAGYVQASLANLTLAPGPAANGDVPLVVSATLNPGDTYTIGAINFSGTPLLSTDAFRSTQKLHVGDVASRKLLLGTLAPLDSAYRRLGYMDVIIKTTPNFNTTAHTVTYTIDVTPGEQYRVHQVTTENLDDSQRADFERSFALKAGQLYDPEYVSNFLTNNTAVRSLSGYMANFKAYADPNQHTVDVVITFAHMAK